MGTFEWIDNRFLPFLCHEFFEQYLGMRVETVDMVELARRIERRIYDEEEYQKAAAWAKENCREGKDYNAPGGRQTPEQKRTAELVKARVAASGKWRRPITTSIEPASTWYSAEGYHQDYLRKHPGGYTCHFMRDEGDSVRSNQP